MSLGPLEVMVILVVALLLFGPDRLPEMGRTVAKGMRELRKLQDSVKADLDSVMHEAGLREDAPSYGTRAADDDLDHEASSNGSGPFPADPDAPAADGSGNGDGHQAGFPIDTDAPSPTSPTAPTSPASPTSATSNGHSVPKPRTGPIDQTPEIVDIDDGGFPQPGSFS
ncbi:MAG: hypothetical protein JWL73_352 [Actinomycetia bacterium]|nr:hypothetical protein [Actinomycetes bacterium]